MKNGCVGGRRREAVGNDVVEPFRALRSEKAQPVHLQRRSARDEDLGATAGRIAVEIDQDVDAVRPYPLRRALGGFGADVDEMLERALDPTAQRALVTGTDRIRVDFEARAVVALPQLGQQMRDRMRAEVGRHVTDLQAASGGGGGASAHARPARIAIRVGKPARDRQQFGGRERQRQCVERNQRVGRVVGKAADVCAQLVDDRVPIGPVADKEPRAQKCVQHASRWGRLAQVGEQRYRLAAAAELDEERGEPILDVDVARRALERLAIAFLGGVQRAEPVLAQRKPCPDIRGRIGDCGRIRVIVRGSRRKVV